MTYSGMNFCSEHNRRFYSKQCPVCHPNPRFTGKKHTPESLQQMREVKLGEKNPVWKGDKVGYASLHRYIRNHLPEPELCSDCHKNKTLELANISQEYKRDFNDWEWLCRRCHMIKDGRLEKLHANREDKK